MTRELSPDHPEASTPSLDSRVGIPQTEPRFVSLSWLGAASVEETWVWVYQCKGFGWDRLQMRVMSLFCFYGFLFFYFFAVVDKKTNL